MSNKIGKKCQINLLKDWQVRWPTQYGISPISVTVGYISVELTVSPGRAVSVERAVSAGRAVSIEQAAIVERR